MLSSRLFLILLLGILGARAEVDVPKPDDFKLTKIYEVNINKLIDKHLYSIRKSFEPLDPTKLEDVKYKLLLVSLTLTRGWMQNLPHFNRIGDCRLVYKDRVLTLEANMIWFDLAVDYRYDFKYWPITKSGDFHAALHDLFVKMVYKYDFKTYKLTLDDITFTRVGELKISTEGNILDKLGRIFLNGLTKLLKDVILKVIEVKFRKMLEHKMPDNSVGVFKPEYLLFDSRSLNSSSFVYDNVN